MRILIIDDEPNKVTETVDALKLRNHFVDVQNPNDGFDTLMATINRYRYDLVFIDYWFKGNNQNHKDGADLCRKLSIHNLSTPIILHTVSGDNFNIAREVLGDYGICYFYGKMEFSSDIDGNLNHILSLLGFKRIQEIRQNRIKESLKVFFKNLSDKQLKAFEDEYNKGLTADWTKPELSIELEGGKYTALELLFDPFSIVDLGKINEQIKIFIDRYQRKYIFHGEKMNKNLVYQYLNNYLNSPNYEEKLEEINTQALNYMLNVLFISNKGNSAYDGVSNFELNSQNRKLKATTAVTNETIFFEKLILRRVAIAFEELISFNNFSKKKLAALMRHGTTNTIKKHNKKDDTIQTKLEEIKSKDVFGTGLGLSSDESNGKFITNDNSILKEELDWILTYGKAAIQLRKYLESLEFSMFNTEIDFCDLNDVKEHLTLIENKLTRIDVQGILKKEIEDYVESSLWEPISLKLIMNLYENFLK